MKLSSARTLPFSRRSLKLYLFGRAVWVDGTIVSRYACHDRSAMLDIKSEARSNIAHDQIRPGVKMFGLVFSELQMCFQLRAKAFAQPVDDLDS